MTFAARVALGGALAWCVGTALAAPEMTLGPLLAVPAVVGLTVWRPIYGCAAVVGLAPAGSLLAPAPIRGAELLAWAFLATWLLRIPRTGSAAPADRPKLLAAGLFAFCAVASWLGLTIGAAAGIEPLALLPFLAASVPADYLIFGAPEPETCALLLALSGLATYAAAATVVLRTGDDADPIAWALAISGACLAVATVAEVGRQWEEHGGGTWFLLRYVRGERFSAHMTDLNAAASHYALAALAAAGLATARGGWRRLACAAAIAAMAPALWLSGSRSAAVAAILVGLVGVPFVRRRVSPAATAAGAVGAMVVALAVVGAAAVAAAREPAEAGTAANALRLRSHFLVTSARMFASAPAYGVGIGRYHERSAEFMPDALRAVYPHENAHNYFAQQFAELGIVGGSIFVWLLAGVFRRGWGAVTRERAANGAMLGLMAGSASYALTCVTGHPLLVAEAALPFWGAFGALAGAASLRRGTAAPRNGSGSPGRRAAAVLVVSFLAAGVALQARRYAATSEPPAERGFYEAETAEDRRPFNWMTRHGVFYIGAQPGTLTIPVRAPDFLPRSRPWLVTVEIGGRTAGVYEVPPGRWRMVEIGLRDRASTRFRRVDLRVNQDWSRMRDLGRLIDDQPRSIMVGEVRWISAGAR